MNMSYMCRYNIDEVCTNYNCDECKQHPMYQQGRADREKELSELPNEYSEKLWKIAYQKGKTNGAREFAEWLPHHFDLRFSNNPDVWLDEYFNHTREKVLAEWQRGSRE